MPAGSGSTSVKHHTKRCWHAGGWPRVCNTLCSYPAPTTSKKHTQEDAYARGGARKFAATSPCSPCNPCWRLPTPTRWAWARQVRLALTLTLPRLSAAGAPAALQRRPQPCSSTGHAPWQAAMTARGSPRHMLQAPTKHVQPAGVARVLPGPPACAHCRFVSPA